MAQVSIIIPVYNAEKYVGAALESVQKQTFRDIEIICIDDGSTDGSAAIIKNLARNDARIRLLQQQNKGVGLAKAAGVQHARGAFIYFVDSDDLIAPETIDTLMRLAIEHNADMVAHRHKHVPESFALPSKTASNTSIRAHAKTVESTRGILKKKISILTCAKLMRKSLFDDFTFPDLRFSEDVNITIHAALKSRKTLALCNKLYFYRRHRASLTNNISSDKVHTLFRSVAVLAANIEARPHLSKAHKKRLYAYLSRYQLYTCVDLLLKTRNQPGIDAFRESFLQNTACPAMQLGLLPVNKRLVMTLLIRGHQHAAVFCHRLISTLKI